MVIDASGDMTGEILKALVSAQVNLPVTGFNLFFNDVEITDVQTLEQVGIGGSDMIEFRALGGAVAGPAQRAPAISLATIPQHLWQNPAQLQLFILDNQNLLQEVLVNNPRLGQAVLSPSPVALANLIKEQQQADRNRRMAEQQRIMQLNADPFSAEAQEAIAEEIRLQAVAENYGHAMEYEPESFGTVVMLYVPMTVNKVPLTAFVDSGAQSTIMSVECAQRCNIMRLIDKRFAGIAKGVGEAKILGRVHAVEVKIGDKFITCSFTILENQGMDFLFGLDQVSQLLVVRL